MASLDLNELSESLLHCRWSEQVDTSPTSRAQTRTNVTGWCLYVLRRTGESRTWWLISTASISTSVPSRILKRGRSSKCGTLPPMHPDWVCTHISWMRLILKVRIEPLSFTLKKIILVYWCHLVFLTHCGLVTSYGEIDLGQHWFR